MNSLWPSWLPNVSSCFPEFQSEPFLKLKEIFSRLYSIFLRDFVVVGKHGLEK